MSQNVCLIDIYLSYIKEMAEQKLIDSISSNGWQAVIIVRMFFYNCAWSFDFYLMVKHIQHESLYVVWMQGLMVSFAEVSSFLVFTLEVAPRLPVQILLPLLSAVFSVYLCHQLWEDVRVGISPTWLGCHDERMTQHTNHISITDLQQWPWEKEVNLYSDSDMTVDILINIDFC